LALLLELIFLLPPFAPLRLWDDLSSASEDSDSDSDCDSDSDEEAELADESESDSDDDDSEDYKHRTHTAYALEFCAKLERNTYFIFFLFASFALLA
jgi:hypothetical protein